jgi:hypothetical protein
MIQVCLSYCLLSSFTYFHDVVYIISWYSFWIQNDLIQLWACTICAACHFEFAHQMSLLFITACSWKDQSRRFTVDSSSSGSFSREPGKKRLLLLLYIRNEYHNFTRLTFFRTFSIGQPTVWENTVGRGTCIIWKLLLSVIPRSNLVIPIQLNHTLICIMFLVFSFVEEQMMWDKRFLPVVSRILPIWKISILLAVAVDADACVLICGGTDDVG